MNTVAVILRDRSDSCRNITCGFVDSRRRRRPDIPYGRCAQRAHRLRLRPQRTPSVHNSTGASASKERCILRESHLDRIGLVQCSCGVSTHVEPSGCIDSQVYQLASLGREPVRGWTFVGQVNEISAVPIGSRIMLFKRQPTLCPQACWDKFSFYGLTFCLLQPGERIGLQHRQRLEPHRGSSLHSHLLPSVRI